MSGSEEEINVDAKFNYPKLKIKVFYIYKTGNNSAFKTVSDYFLCQSKSVLNVQDSQIQKPPRAKPKS